jgi:hypothetical protein
VDGFASRIEAPKALEKVLERLAPDALAWRLTIPEGHRVEATQAPRQVLDRAVA